MLTLGYATDDGRFILDDETANEYAKGDYATLELIVPLDVEMTIYKVTGVGGAILPKDPAMRERLRTIFRAAAIG
jgi:hypothetical protein